MVWCFLQLLTCNRTLPSYRAVFSHRSLTSTVALLNWTLSESCRIFDLIITFKPVNVCSVWVIKFVKINFSPSNKFTNVHLNCFKAFAAGASSRTPLLTTLLRPPNRGARGLRPLVLLAPHDLQSQNKWPSFRKGWEPLF